MNTTLYWTLVWILIIGIPVVSLLTIYWLALKNICFTLVRQGEIIAIMAGDELWEFIGKIDGHWVDPLTGEVYRTKRLEDGYDDIPLDGGPESPNARVKPAPGNLPQGFFGVYFIGIWPVMRRYTYRFRWNKWEKNDTGNRTKYALQPRDEKVDSLFWMSAYAFEIDAAENADRLPFDATIVATLRIVNAGKALFGVKNGWLAELDGNVTGSGRDFIGSVKTDEISRLQHESGQAPNTPGAKSFIETLKLLNKDGIGNESVLRVLGVEIVTASFVKVDITAGPLRDRHIDMMTRQYDSEQAAAAMNRETEAMAKRVNDLGAARATATEKLGTALKGKPELAQVAIAEEARKGAEAMAEAIKSQKTATTLIIGQGAVPTMNVKN